jgi:hypothetical protein
MSEPKYIEEVLDRGSGKASVIAQQTWQDVKTRVGLEIIEDTCRNLQLSKKGVQ